MQKKLNKSAILHVDDDERFLDLFRLKFSKFFDISSIDCVKNALELLTENEFEAIITDYDMPDTNGLEFLSLLRKSGSSLPVIFYTGQGNEKIAREAFIQGASDYFTKDIYSFAHTDKIVNSIKRAIEIRKSAKAKRESEEKYRGLTDLLPQAVYETDLQGNLTYVNKYAFDAFGYTEEDFNKGINVIELIIPEERTRAKESMVKVYKGEKTNPGEYNVFKKDGTLFPALIYSSPIIKENKPVGLRGIILDITEINHAKLLRSIQRDIGFAICEKGGMKEILDRILEAVFRIREIDGGAIYLEDNSGDFRLVSHKGLTKETVNIFSCIKAETSASVTILNGDIIYIQMDESINQKELIERENLKIVGIIPVKYEGKVIGCFSIFSHSLDDFPPSIKSLLETIAPQIGSVIARIRAEESLKKRESKLESIFRAAPVGIGMLIKRTFIRVNDRLCTMLGYSREELLGKSSGMFFLSDKDYKSTGEIISDRIQKDGIGTIETRMKKKDGKIIDVLLSYTPLDTNDLSAGMTITVLNITNRKRTENQFIKTNALLKAVFDQAPFGIHIAEGNSQNWKLTMMNKKAVEIFGMTEEEQIGIGVEKDTLIDVERLTWKMFHADGTPWEIVDSPLPMAMKEQRIIENEELIIRQSKGKEINILCTASPVYNDKKEQIAGIAIIPDITEIKKTEKALKSEREFIDIVLNSITDTLFVFEPSTGKAVRWNKAFREISGYSDEEIAQLKAPDSYYNKEEIENAYKTIQEASKTGKAVVELNLISKEGKRIPTEYIGTPIRDNNTGKEYMVSIGRDITTRVKALNALKESEEKFRVIAEESPNMIFINKRGKIVYANRKCEEIMGYIKEELYSDDFDFMDLIAPNSKDTVTAYYEKHKNSNELIDYECSQVTKSGTYIDVIIRTRVIEYTGERAILGIVTDISKRKQMEKELIERNKELSDFAYRVSHDLKNPINIIRGYSEAISEEPEIANQYLHKIIKQTDKIQLFINNILKLSKAGKIIGDKKAVDINSMIYRIYISQKSNQVPMELKIKNSIPEIIGDYESLENLFTNIIENSIKYRDKEKDKLVIEVDSKINESEAVIQIKDNGTGIDKDKAAAIFHPGFTLSKDKGTGFGLSIARKIVEAHNGSITAKSDGEKQGVEITVRLPIE